MPAPGVSAPNEPELLICRSPFDPAGEPPLPPAGVAQVPSPRQKVVLEAPVPLLRLPTGRLPLTSALSRTVSVLLAPSIVLPESVCASVVPTTAPVGNALPPSWR